MLDSAGNKLEKGKFIVLWKQEKGIWKMYRDIWNSDASPLPTPSAPVK
jgi:ketosteroid isomerase-like protein